MRRTKRPRSPGRGWVKEYSLEEREELLKRPRRSTHRGEPEERSTRKHHHFKTYERCHQTRRLEQREQCGAKEPNGGSKAGGQIEVEGSLVKNNHGKVKNWLPGSDGTKTDPNRDTQNGTADHHSRSPGHSRQRSSHTQHTAASHTQADPSQGKRAATHTQPIASHRTHRTPSHTDSSSRSRSRSADSRSRRTKRKSCDDDEEGHLVYHHGLILKERYEVVSTLGEGAFGKVVECLDRDKGTEHVALKIVKNMERFREAAMSEIRVLEEINSLDDDKRFACVRMLDWFDHHGHICIVFELLGLSTFDFLKKNDFLPFTVDQIRRMAYQIFRAVCFLHRNKKRDERTLRSLDVKVVDFGNATFDHEHHTSLVSTRHYRAPEVILDLGWNQACDVWSLGCILMEFYLGLTLFQTHDSKEHLAMMERVLGPIPPHLLNKTRKHHYVHWERLDWDEHSSSGRYVRKHCKPLKQYMQSKTVEHEQLFDLIGSMMEYDVSRRITLEEALWHPFFSPLRKD
ncbi:dual specificity protein kinase CLK4-like isoform 2-T2 [Polymixia lowei]